MSIYHSLRRMAVRCQTYGCLPRCKVPPLSLSRCPFLGLLSIGGWVGLCGCLYTETVYQWTVTHLSTNWAWHRVTSLVWSTPLLLHQTTTLAWSLKNANCCQSPPLITSLTGFIPCQLKVWRSGEGVGSRLERLRVQLPAVPLSGNDLGQVVHTHVPLSPSSIIWYQSRGSDVLRLGR